HFFDVSAQELDGGRTAYDFCEAIAGTRCRSRLGAQQGFDFAQHALEPTQADGLLQIVDGPAAQGLDGAIDRGMASEENDPRAGKLKVQPELHAVSIGKLHIEQDDVRAPALDQDARLPDVSGLFYVVPFFRSDLCNKLPGFRFIFDNK